MTHPTTAGTTRQTKVPYIFLLGGFVLLALFFYLSQINYHDIVSVGDNFTFEIFAKTVFSEHPFKINIKFDYFTPHPINHHQRSFPPLFPVLIAIAHILFGQSIYVNFILNSFIGVSVAFVVYYLGLNWFEDQLSSLLAAVFTVFSFTLVDSSILGLSEPLFTLTSLLSLYFISSYLQVAKWKSLIIAGIFSGLAYLTRTNGLAVIAAFFLVLLLDGREQPQITKRLKAALLFLGTVVLVTTPWLIRNYLVFGDLFHYIGRYYAGSKPGYYIVGLFPEPQTLTWYFKNSSWSEIFSRYLGSTFSSVSLIFKETHVFLLLSIGGFFTLLKQKRSVLPYSLYFLFGLGFVILPPFIKARYFVNLNPLIYLLGAFYLVTKFSWLEQFINEKKYRLIFFGTLLLTVGLYAFFFVSPRLTKVDHYAKLYKDVGMWLKENSSPGSVVMSSWTPDLNYYSDRPVIMNPRNLAAKELDALVEEYQVDYFIAYKIYVAGTIAPSSFYPVKIFTVNQNGETKGLVLFKKI